MIKINDIFVKIKRRSDERILLRLKVLNIDFENHKAYTQSLTTGYESWTSFDKLFTYFKKG